MDPRNQSHTNSEKGYKTCTNLHLICKQMQEFLTSSGIS
jgi:hypothetical protein